MKYPDLNLPRYSFDVQTVGGVRKILDPIRRKRLILTPEEWVRQHVVQFLVQERGCPAGLTSLEHSFLFEGRQRRADIVVYGRDSKPRILVECKAADIRLNQAVFDQIARYNLVVGASLLIVTNGLNHFCYTVESRPGTPPEFKFLDDVPKYDILTY